LIYIDTSEEETTDEEHERLQQNSRQKRKKKSATKQTKEIFARLDEMHGGKFPRGHLMLWAHTLVSKTINYFLYL
jgi:urease accessory protein UreE